MVFFNRKRKIKKEKIENLYKILGTRSNIGQDRIKEKYIEKIREFPPETHPEEFQEIRRAYETLKDPKKRKQYDMTRKYGDKLEKTMEDVIYSIDIGEYKNAKELLKYVAEIAPYNIAVKCLQAEVLLKLDELEQFFALIDNLLENYDMEYKEQIITFVVNLLMSNDYEDEALNILEQNKSYYEDIKEYYSLRIKIFICQDNYQQAWV